MRWTDTEIIVTFRAEYYHSWPNAPSEHAYLAQLHRHEIHFNVMMTQKADRAIEFIELKNELIKRFSELKAGVCLAPASSIPAEVYNAMGTIWRKTASMEDLAYVLAEYLAAKYGPTRWIRVVALEDGENGASYTHVPDVLRSERDEAAYDPPTIERLASDGVF